MINYFWMGLIVIAVFFAVSMDLTGVRPYEEPFPQVVEDFEGETSWKVSTSDWPVPGWFLVSADYDSAGEGHSGQLNYRFEDSNPVALSIGAVISSATQKPDRLEMMILGDGSGHNLEFQFVDTDGEYFFGPEVKKLSKSKSWMKVSVPLDELIPSPENPAAVVDDPLRLDQIVLVRSQSSGVQEGQIYFDQVRLRYPVVFRVKEELMSDTWMGVITKSSARWAQLSITLALELIGIMMLWLGLMRIAEQAGLIQLLARGVKPVMRRLFPGIPPDGEAMGAILMNIAANMLGLGNAATPMGLKAMEELQKLNRNKEYASNAMCMLLAINTSGVELIPAALIGYRAAAGSVNIMQFWPLMVAATTISTVVAIIVCKICERLSVFRVPEPQWEDLAAEEEEGE